MTEHNHVVVWIDHQEARIFHFNETDVDRMVIHPKNKHVHIHHKTNTIGSGHEPEDQKFLHAVIEGIGQAKAVLIAGPGIAKTALVKHISKHDPAIMDRINGVETVDHPTDGMLVSYAREYFKVADHLTPQK